MWILPLKGYPYPAAGVGFMPWRVGRRGGRPEICCAERIYGLPVGIETKTVNKAFPGIESAFEEVPDLELAAASHA